MSAREADNQDNVMIGEVINPIMRRSKQQPKRINRFIEAFSGGNLIGIGAIEKSSSLDYEQERVTKADENINSGQNITISKNGRPMTTGTGKRRIISNTESGTIVSPQSAIHLRISRGKTLSQSGLGHSFSRPTGTNTVTNLQARKARFQRN